MKPPPGFRDATDWERQHRPLVGDVYSDGEGGLFVEQARLHDSVWHVILHVAGGAFIAKVLWHLGDWLIF